MSDGRFAGMMTVLWMIAAQTCRSDLISILLAMMVVLSALWTVVCVIVEIGQKKDVDRK